MIATLKRFLFLPKVCRSYLIFHWQECVLTSNPYKSVGEYFLTLGTGNVSRKSISYLILTLYVQVYTSSSPFWFTTKHSCCSPYYRRVTRLLRRLVPQNSPYRLVPGVWEWLVPCPLCQHHLVEKSIATSLWRR